MPKARPIDLSRLNISEYLFNKKARATTTFVYSPTELRDMVNDGYKGLSIPLSNELLNFCPMQKLSKTNQLIQTAIRVSFLVAGLSIIYFKIIPHH